VILASLNNSFYEKLLVFKPKSSIEEGGRKEGVEKDTIWCCDESNGHQWRKTYLENILMGIELAIELVALLLCRLLEPMRKTELLVF
jgi:hypothetical protein